MSSTHPTALQRRVLRHRGVWSEDVAEALGESVFDVRDARAALGLCPQTGEDLLDAAEPAQDRVRWPSAGEIDALMRTNRSVCG